MDRFISSLADSFRHHAPNELQIEDIGELRQAADTFAALIDIRVPDSREKSLAKTKLEECLMWAVKAIVLPSNNKKVD